MKWFEEYLNYDITIDGKVFNKKTNKYLKPYKTKKGYIVITFCIDGKAKRFSLHRILAEKYIPNPDNKPQINHINGIKDDNRIENLEWVSCSENIQHSFKILKRMSPPKKYTKENHPNKNKPILQFDKNNNFIREFNSLKEAFEITKIWNIPQMLIGLRKSAGGFIWKYKNNENYGI